jgi:hypothetical protein
MTAMRIRRIYLTAILAIAPASTVILATFVASPPNVQLSSAPVHDAPLDDLGIPGVSVDVDYGVPNLNAVDHVVPNINVPNVNLPNVKINPGHVGLPGRGR